MKSIGNGLLKNLKCIQKLNLNQNEIYSYDETSFFGLKLLTNIYLSLKRLKLNDFYNIKSSISSKPYKRNILGSQYYYATNLIDQAHEIDCELTLFFIKSNTQLNLFTDNDLDEFVTKCFGFDFKSEKKYIMKCESDEKTRIDAKDDLLKESKNIVSTFQNMISNFFFWITFLALLTFLVPIFLLLFFFQLY